jgi:hypothetical protein
MYIFDFNVCIDSCVLLENLKIHCLISDENLVKERMFKERRMQDRISTIKQQHAVRLLHLDLPLIHDDSLTYTMHKFPSLSTLKLWGNKFRTTEHPYEICRKFLEYISKIRFINIRQLEISNVCELLPITFKDRIISDKSKTLLIVNYNSSLLNEGMSYLAIETERGHSDSTSISYFMDQTKCSCKIDILFAASNYYNGFALPHVMLIENLGNEITALQLDCKNKTEIFKNIPTYYFLDHILENFSQLEDLDLSGTFLIHCDPTLPIKKYLNTLSLHYCDIYPSFLSELSPLLPSLGHLHFDSCNFISEDGQQLPQSSCLFLNMPHTSITSLFIYPSFSDYNSFYIKVKTYGEKEMYYVIVNLRSPVFFAVFEDKFYYHWNGEQCFKMGIECFSIKLLCVRLPMLSKIYEIDCLTNMLI